MTLLAIILGTLAAGIGSVWLAAWLSFGIVSRYTQHMLSLAAGALLATAFLHLLPEAFEGGIEPHNLFVTLLVGLLFFFLLDKAELWHHGHEHHHHHHDDGHGAPKAVKKAVKCDMCKGQDGGPACVRACPTGAALRVSPEEFVAFVQQEASRF